MLPFLNLSSDKENEYFSDGLAEEIINALTRIENLRVTARTSAFVFRGAQQDVRKIGETLHVASVLEGSVRKAGNRVRISVQLIGVGDGNNLWSERYDREMTDVFEIQDEISQAIVAKLKVKLTSTSGSGSGVDRRRVAAAPLVKRYTENLEAYDLYLRGPLRALQNDARRSGYQQDSCSKKRSGSTRTMRSRTMAWRIAGIRKASSVSSRRKEAMPKAKAAVRRAIELDETVARSACHAGCDSRALRLGLGRRPNAR